LIIRPKIFDRFPEIVAAQSTRLGGVSSDLFGMNLSSHVGDEKENVEQNRKLFFDSVGLPSHAMIVYQNQIHSANVNEVEGSEGVVPSSDALFTSSQNVFLAVSIADCTPVLLYAPDIRVIAAIHAGWRGTEQMIVLKAVRALIERGADSGRIHAFIGASASKERYEVGIEVATLFDKRHLIELPGQTPAVRKFLLDVKGANFEQLTYSGIPPEHIEVSSLCTISNSDLHSFRRDGKQSGRMLAIVGRVEHR
jgi:YfiH family protein